MDKYSQAIDPQSAEGQAIVEIAEELRHCLARATSSFKGERRAQMAIAGVATIFVECLRHGIKPEHRLGAFDEYVATMRRHLEGGGNEG